MLNLLPHLTLNFLPPIHCPFGLFSTANSILADGRQNHLALTIIAAIALATNLPTARAGPVTSIGSSGQSVPTQAVELDETARSIVEVELAIKNFEHRDFDQCIQRLAKAGRRTPSYLPQGPFLPNSRFWATRGP